MAASLKSVDFPIGTLFGKDVTWLRCTFRIDPEICELELVDTEVTGAESFGIFLWGTGVGAQISVKVNKTEGTVRCDSPEGTCKRVVTVYAAVYAKAAVILSFSRHVGDVTAIFSTTCSEACCAN